MDPPISNEQKWKHFLSSIDTCNTLRTTKLKITTKINNERLLATAFANKLKKKIPKTIENVQEKPEAISAQNADTIIPEVPQTDTNKYVKETSVQNADAIIPEVPQTDTNKHVKETSAEIADAIIPEVPQIDTNEHVKETSAQSADTIIPEVPETDTNEHMEEMSAQSDGAIIPEVSQTDTNKHVKEMSSQNDDAIISEVPETNTNEHVEELFGQNANAIIPEVPQNDTNEHVKEMSTQSADAIIPEVSHTDTNEHVEEMSGQSEDAIIPQVPQSIKNFKKLPTNILKIKTKGKKRPLAYKLLKKEGDTVVSTGKAKSKDENIDNIDEPAKKQVRRNGSDDDNSESLLPIYDRAKIHHVDSQDSEEAIPPKIAKTNENVQEKPEAISTTFSNSLVKRFDDRKGNVKETSAQNADDIIPQVPQTDTNEHVKETSAQNADSIIPEVSQTDTNENVKETSAQNADAIIPEVSQTDTNEHVKETSVQNADAIIPEGPQTDANERVKETSAQSADAVIPEVPLTDANEHVEEMSAQNDDAIIPQVPPSIKTSKNMSTYDLKIKTKSKKRSLTTEFANKLLKKEGDPVVSTGKPKSKDQSIDNIDELIRRRSRRHGSDDNSESLLPTYDSDKIQHVDSQHASPTKIAKTTENVEEKHEAISTTFSNSFVKWFDDTDENVKDTSAQNADTIIPKVSQTDTNEHVKEISAQSADDIIPEVPQNDTKEHVKELSAQMDDAIILQVPQTDKNEHVKETSAQNANAINPKSPQTDTNEHVKEMSTQNDGAIIPEVSQITEINRSRYRDTHAPSKKSDIDKACGKWNVLNIAEYFIFDDCVTEIKMPTGVPPNLDKIYKMVQKDIRLRLEIVNGINLKATEKNLDSEFLIQLKSTTIAKTGNRLVLDALLIPLCSVLNLKLEVDKNIDCIFLPNCIFDYCIRKGEHIIGCIEAQSVKSLSDSSVAQAVLQLMILQTALIVTGMPEVKVEKFPVFAIVTDGHRFIYMQLKGSSLGFEYEGGKVRIRKVRKEDDFKDILRHISFLVDGF